MKEKETVLIEDFAIIPTLQEIYIEDEDDYSDFNFEEEDDYSDLSFEE